MFIITVKEKKETEAYSVIDEDDDKVLYIFEEEDDALRYSLQLEDMDYPEMSVLEIDDEIMIKTCDYMDTGILLSLPLTL